MDNIIRLIVLEPFYGGSHKQLVDTILNALKSDELRGKFSVETHTLSPKKWPWRARCGALMLSDIIPRNGKYDVLFCSSDLNLSELIGIRPDLNNCRKIVYFHENQLVYPVQKSDKLDFQFGYNQILTSLAADVVLFNSRYNMNSFLGAVPAFLQKIPDFKPKNIVEKLRDKCKVQYFLIDFNEIPSIQFFDHETAKHPKRQLHILWAHRWEYDKDPKTFFDVLIELQDSGLDFCVSVLGQGFTDVSPIFEETKAKLHKGTIKNWGYLPSRLEYLSVLKSCDVAVSTALHEFFGVSMIESVYCGCYPLCPNRLVYPEIYPTECLYNTKRQLFKRLREFCRKPWLAAQLRSKMNLNFSPYSLESAKSDFLKVFQMNDRSIECCTGISVAE